MEKFVLIIAGIYGAFSVLLGAFGAHALKKILDENALQSFETGVRYLMYHALLLLFLALHFDFSRESETWTVSLIMIGVFLFSFSIFGLVLGKYKNIPVKFLGPVTPLGGMMLLIGWILLTYNFMMA